MASIIAVTLLIRSHQTHTVTCSWIRYTLLTRKKLLLWKAHISPFLFQDGQGQSNNVLVGHPFLRQLRVHQQPCPESSYLPNAAQLCRYGYTSSSQDMGSSNNSWVSPPGGSTVWGEMASYSAGGFSMLLNQSRYIVFLYVTLSHKTSLKSQLGREIDAGCHSL